MGLVGCVGELDGGMNGGGDVGGGTNPNPNGTDSAARKLFETNVYPIIHNPGAASDCSQCHNAASPQNNTTGFVAPDLTDAYGTITSYQTVVGSFAPSSAGILTKIAAAGGHQGRVFTDAQKASITDWLNLEVTERATSGGGGGTTSTNESYSAATARVLNNWSACMTLDNFKTANMAQAWGNMQTNNGTRCAACHSTGGYGMLITGVEQTDPNGGPPGLFSVLSENQYFMVMYFSVDLSDLTRDASGKLMNAKMLVNMDSFKGVAEQQPPHVQHPTFNYQNNPGMTALQTFYTSTMTAAGAGNCGTTKLNPPAQ